MDSVATSSGIKGPEREVSHSPPFIAEVKNSLTHAATPLYAFVVNTRKILLLRLGCNISYEYNR